MTAFQKSSKKLSLEMKSEVHYKKAAKSYSCLLYTSDAADEWLRVDLGGRRIIKKGVRHLIL